MDDEKQKKSSTLSVLVHRVGEKESEVDVDAIYNQLRDRMVRVLAKETGVPDSEFAGDDAIKMMGGIEELVSLRVTEIKKQPDTKYYEHAKTQRDKFLKEKRLNEGLENAKKKDQDDEDKRKKLMETPD